MPVETCEIIQYKNVIVIIGTFARVIKIIDKRNSMRSFFLPSLYLQTLQLFNEYGVKIFHYYNGSENKARFEYVDK